MSARSRCPGPTRSTKGEKLSQQRLAGRRPASLPGRAAARRRRRHGQRRARDGRGAMPAVGLARAGGTCAAALEHAELLRAWGRLTSSPSSTPARATMPASPRTMASSRAGPVRSWCWRSCCPASTLTGKPTDDLEVLRRDLRLREGPDRARRRAAGADRRLAGLRPEMHLAGRRLAEGARPGSSSRPRPGPHSRACRSAAACSATSPSSTASDRRPGLFDFVGHTICPIVHAGDDLSLTEGLEALPYILPDRALFAGDTPYWLFPPRSRCARTPTAPPRPRTRTAAAWPWPASTRASMP